MATELSSKDTPMIVGIFRYEEIMDENNEMHIDDSKYSPFECVSDLYSNLYIILSDCSTKKNPSTKIRKKLMGCAQNTLANFGDYFCRIKYKNSKPVDAILYNQLQLLVQNNNNIQYEPVLDNVKNIIDKIQSKQIHQVNRQYLDVAELYATNVDCTNSKTVSFAYAPIQRTLSLQDKHKLNKQLFVFDNTNNSTDEFKDYKPPTPNDVEYIFSKVVFKDDIKIDKYVKNAMKTVIFANIDIITSKYPNIAVRQFKNYTGAKSVILVVQVKTKPKGNNFKAFVDRGQKMSSKILILKVTNNTIEAQSEIDVSLKLQTHFGGRVSKVYPETVHYFIYNKETLGALYLMDIFNTDVTWFNQQIDKYSNLISYAQKMKLKLYPIFNALIICAQVRERKQVIHLDVKPKNICLDIDFSSEPVSVGKDGLKMYRFKIVMIDWGLSEKELKYRMKDGYGPDIIGSPVYIPDILSNTSKQCQFLSFAGGISILDNINYEYMEEDKSFLTGTNDYKSKMEYLITELFVGDNNYINKQIADLLIASINEENGLNEIDFLTHDLFYIKEMGIAEQYLNDNEEENMIYKMIKLRMTMAPFIHTLPCVNKLYAPPELPGLEKN